jgi:hypothetical protein
MRARERENNLPFTRCSICVAPVKGKTRSFNDFMISSNTMEGDEDWNAFLQDHPIFTTSKAKGALSSKDELSLELSLSTLSDFSNAELRTDDPTPSGRRQVMVIKDYDIILAIGKEIRMTSLGDAKYTRNSQGFDQKTYKVCTSAIVLT